MVLAREGLENDNAVLFKVWMVNYGGFGVFVCADHVRFDLCHPYIDHLPMV
jgi:hypothetical protein